MSPFLPPRKLTKKLGELGVIPLLVARPAKVQDVMGFVPVLDEI